MAEHLIKGNDMIVTSLSLIDESKSIDVKELFIGKLDTIYNIVGLAPDTLPCKSRGVHQQRFKILR